MYRDRRQEADRCVYNSAFTAHLPVYPSRERERDNRLGPGINLEILIIIMTIESRKLSRALELNFKWIEIAWRTVRVSVEDSVQVLWSETTEVEQTLRDVLTYICRCYADGINQSIRRNVLNLDNCYADLMQT